MKYYIFKNDANIPLLGIEGEPDQALCPTKPELEFWARIQELETALTNISTMPEYDQDDAHRLRGMAKRALASK